MRAWWGLAVATVALALGGGPASAFALTPFATDTGPEIAGLTAAQEATALGRGANLGGLLEAPTEGAWGLTLSEAMFKAAADGGFKTIRLPVRFSNHAAATAPYGLDEAFMQRVDFAVNQALSDGLNIIIDFHHYHEMDGDPPDQGETATGLPDDALQARFLAIWTQIGQRYQSLPNDKVLFELYNEPHGKTATVWNALLVKALAAVRGSNPYRFVLVDPVEWSTPSGLVQLKLPKTDQRLIVDVHSYEPYHFTMQGADWIEGSDKWRGTTCCDAGQVKAMTAPLDVAVAWSKKSKRPVMLGEFGSQDQAPYPDRVVYTAAMREAAEARGMSWAYWDFASGEFGPWISETNTWRTELHDALVPPN